MNTPTIRSPRSHESKTVAKLYRLAQSDNPYSVNPATVTQRVLSGDATVTSPFPQTMPYRSDLTVADIDGNVVGFCLTASPLAWYRKRNEDAGDMRGLNAIMRGISEIQLLAVDPDFQEQGIATALVTDAETTMVANGRRAAYVTVWRKNARVASWWQRRGYVLADPGRAWLWHASTSSRSHRFDVVTTRQHLGVKTFDADCHTLTQPGADPMLFNVGVEG